MISEIYAVGHAGTSAFVIVENGIVVHYGSHKWNGFIDFEGVSFPVNDTDCEVMAVICALMMCRQNSRMAVNIYTSSHISYKRYACGECDSVFAGSLAKHSDGMHIYAERWPLTFFANGSYVDNEHVSKVLALARQ